MAVSVLIRACVAILFVKNDIGGTAGIHGFAWGVLGRIAGSITLALVASPGLIGPTVLGGTEEFLVPDIFIGVIGWDYSGFVTSELFGELLILLLIPGLLCSGLWQYGLTMLVEWKRDRRVESGDSTRIRLR